MASFNAESLHEQTNFVLDRIVEASVVSIDATGQSYNRPRLTMPSDGQSGWIDIGQYFAMEDPVEAGRLLMIEAKKVGLNLDDSSRVWKETEPLYVRAGRIDSSEDTFEFMRRVRQEPRVGKAGMGSYLVRLRRFPTIRECAKAMSSGVRLSRAFGAEVMAMKSDQVAGLSSLPYVKWIRPYLPEFKYRRDDVFESKADSASNVSIYTIGGDQASWRLDVKRRGGVIHGGLVADYIYQATVPPDSMGSIARLWWVLIVEPAGEPVDD